MSVKSQIIESYGSEIILAAEGFTLRKYAWCDFGDLSLKKIQSNEVTIQFSEKSTGFMEKNMVNNLYAERSYGSRKSYYGKRHRSSTMTSCTT